MNDTDFTFNRLVKVNSERPSFGNESLLSQVRKICVMDLSHYKLQLMFVTLFELVKMKRGTHPSRWGNRGKGGCFSFSFMVVYSPPLNMAPVCICISEQLGFSSCLQVDPLL